MGGTKKWHASSTGPDWTDISEMCRLLERHHSVWVSVRILNGGSTHSNALRIVCAAFTNVLVATADVGIVTVPGMWPNPDNASVEGTVYRLLSELDFKLSKELWEQKEMDTA